MLVPGYLSGLSIPPFLLRPKPLPFPSLPFKLSLLLSEGRCWWTQGWLHTLHHSSKHYLENNALKVIEKCKGLPEWELEDQVWVYCLQTVTGASCQPLSFFSKEQESSLLQRHCPKTPGTKNVDAHASRNLSNQVSPASSLVNQTTGPLSDRLSTMIIHPLVIKAKHANAPNFSFP